MLFPLMLLWVVVGLIVGFVASKIVNLRGDDPKAGIFLGGLTGGVVGLIWNVSSGVGLTGWNIMSAVAAAIGAAIAVLIWHLVRSRFVSRASFTTRRSY